MMVGCLGCGDGCQVRILHNFMQNLCFYPQKALYKIWVEKLTNFIKDTKSLVWNLEYTSKILIV